MIEVEESESMREGMRRLASGVSVLSAVCGQGHRHAMTVSSVTSVSDRPASLLVCVNEVTAMHGVIGNEGDKFVVNVLSSDQEEVSNLCAGQEQGQARFNQGDWQEMAGLPYLADAQAAFICHVDKAFQYGTHKIIIGCINKVLVSAGEIDPLVYLNGGYRKIS